MAVAQQHPMFERRELTRVLTVHSKHLQRNIQSSLLGQIKASVEGRCGTEGYVQPKSSVILEYSLGRMSILKPGVSYRVKFQADICLPHKGQRLEVPASFRSKIGLHADTKPLKILMPRDLHIGNAEFESVSDGDMLEVEVMGAEFKQNDENIFVLAKFLRRIAAPPVSSSDAAAALSVEVPMFPSAASGSSEVKSVSITTEAPSSAKTTSAPIRRKKRLQTSNTLEINVGSTGDAAGPTPAAGPE
jgi:DNA-directed RNA polymerase subunit E'/Rpb7